MKKIVGLTVAAVAASALVPLTAGGAFAAPPGNDTPNGAVTITKGETVKENTTQATTGSLDKKINARCGAPHTNASVWFQYTATDDNGIVLDASASNYGVGLMLFRGSSPTPDSLFRCGPEGAVFHTSPGRVYTIMAFSYTQKMGGDLSITVEQAPPPAAISVQIHKQGVAYPGGNARVSGTYTCSNADFAASGGTLTQVWKRLKIGGDFRVITGLCDGAPHHWSKTVVSSNGLYGAGAATVKVGSVACSITGCTRSSATQDVTLKAAQLPSGGSAKPAAAPRPGVAPCTATRSGTMWQHGSASCAATR